MTPESLVQTVASAVMDVIRSVGREGLEELRVQIHRRGVGSEEVPYVLWALTTKSELPSLGGKSKGYDLWINILSRTGLLPNYQRGFRVVDDEAVDSAVDGLALHMADWSVRTMTPALVVGYFNVLKRHQNKVSQVTGGEVPVSNGMDYLNEVLRELVTLRSSLFEDGELLRRVLRFIPNW